MRGDWKMKTALKISFVFNLGFIGCLIYCLANLRWPLKESSPSPAAANTILPQQAAAPALPVLQQPEPATFRWSQLESTSDYRIYVKNLRSIGCPEQTLRDIVMGNVDRAFSAERTQLSLDENDPGPWSQQAEVRFVDILLGEASDSMIAGVSAPEQSTEQDTIPSYPLVLQKVDLDALGLNDDQKQEIAQIRQQFIDAIGGPYQDPGDPAYLVRWQKAQPESDDMIKGMLGVSVFENYQLAAANPQNGNK